MLLDLLSFLLFSQKHILYSFQIQNVQSVQLKQEASRNNISLSRLTIRAEHKPRIIDSTIFSYSQVAYMRVT